jgi:hypothetical protein
VSVELGRVPAEQHTQPISHTFHAPTAPRKDSPSDGLRKAG